MYKKPVVVSDGAGVSELVMDGVNGYQFESGNHEELAEKVHKILDNPAHSEEMGERGYETARQCYIEEGVKLVMDVFNDVMTDFKH